MPVVTARAAARFFNSLNQRIEKAVVRAETASMDDAKRTAITLSSGKHSLADLAKAGHPYARRAPQTRKYPPQIINIQTEGGFATRWRGIAPTRRGRMIITRVVNDDPKKAFMDGTPLMVTRPIAKEVRRRIRKRRIRRYTTALRKALTFK